LISIRSVLCYCLLSFLFALSFLGLCLSLSVSLFLLSSPPVQLPVNTLPQPTIPAAPKMSTTTPPADHPSTAMHQSPQLPSTISSTPASSSSIHDSNSNSCCSTGNPSSSNFDSFGCTPMVSEPPPCPFPNQDSSSLSCPYAEATHECSLEKSGHPNCGICMYHENTLSMEDDFCFTLCKCGEFLLPQPSIFPPIPINVKKEPIETTIQMDVGSQ
jgi:hypothetical protein